MFGPRRQTPFIVAMLLILCGLCLGACHHHPRDPDTANQAGHYDTITHPDGSQERVWRPDPQ
jgi:hypothetical protein